MTLEEALKGLLTAWKTARAIRDAVKAKGDPTDPDTHLVMEDAALIDLLQQDGDAAGDHIAGLIAKREAEAAGGGDPGDETK